MRGGRRRGNEDKKRKNVSGGDERSVGTGGKTEIEAEEEENSFGKVCGKISDPAAD